MNPYKSAMTHQQARHVLQSPAHLTPRERVTLNSHLSRCAECQAYAKELHAMQAIVTRALHERWDYHSPDPTVSGRVTQRTGGRQSRNRFYALAGACGVVLLVVLVAVSFYRPAPLGSTEPIVATRVPAAEAHAQQAEQLWAEGQLREAVPLYQKALKLDPDQVEYWNRLAYIQAYIEMTRIEDSAEPWAEAAETAQHAIALDPENSTAYAVLAFALNELEDYEKASQAAVRAIELDPNNALAYACYGEILVHQERWPQANDAIQQALLLDPNSMDAYRVKGYYLYSIGEYEAALEAYQAALEIGPNLSVLHFYLGLLYGLLGQDDLALQHFVSVPPVEDVRNSAEIQPLITAIEQDPTHAVLHGLLGLEYSRLLDPERAAVELGCAVEGCTTKTDTVDDAPGAPELTITGLPLDSDTIEF